MVKGTLYLIPAPVSDNTQHQVIPAGVTSVLKGLHDFLAEDVRTSRRYLRSLGIYERLDELNFQVLTKDTPPQQMEELFAPIHEGRSMGVITEAGCPGIADPGATAVTYAHEHHVCVVPLVGPSSLVLALMASGLNGQQFAFHGYLPVDAAAATKHIRDLEKESALRGQTQIFIETPYRNTQLLNRLVKTLRPSTRLCVSLDLTGAGEWILTAPVAIWRLRTAGLSKLPCLFLFQSETNPRNR